MAESKALDVFARLDRKGAKTGHADEAGRSALGLHEKFARRVMNIHLGIAPRVAEIGRQLRRFDNSAMRYLFARRIAYQDVRARIIRRV